MTFGTEGRSFADVFATALAPTSVRDRGFPNCSTYGHKALRVLQRPTCAELQATGSSSAWRPAEERAHPDRATHERSRRGITTSLS